MGKSERKMNDGLLNTLRFMKSRRAVVFTQQPWGIWRNMNTKEIITAAEIGAITLIDLRDAPELHSSGQATGALHIPLAELVAKADPSSPQHDRRIAQGKPIAVYSAAGRRSKIAIQVLNGFGYQAVDIGGFYVWAAAGGPVSHYS